MQRAIDDVERKRSDAFTKIKEKLLIQDAKKLITTLSLSPNQPYSCTLHQYPASMINFVNDGKQYV